MLGFASLDPFSPHSPGRRLHFPSHQADHLRLTESKLHFDRIEGRPVFPGHLDDAVDISCLQGFKFIFCHVALTKSDADLLEKELPSYLYCLLLRRTLQELLYYWIVELLQD